MFLGDRAVANTYAQSVRGNIRNTICTKLFRNSNKNIYAYIYIYNILCNFFPTSCTSVWGGYCKFQTSRLGIYGTPAKLAVKTVYVLYAFSFFVSQTRSFRCHRKRNRYAIWTTIDANEYACDFFYRLRVEKPKNDG